MVDEVETELSIPSPEPLTNLLFDRVKRSGDRIVNYSKVNGRWLGTTWQEAYVRIEEISLGLLDLGADRGDAIAIVSSTRQEWGTIDLAILCIGGVTVGVYPTLTAPQSKYLIDHSAAKVVFVEDAAQRDKIESVHEPGQVTIVQIEGPVEETPHRMSLDALRRRGAKRRIEHPEEFERRARENKSGDVITHVYTSGTTGEPKGAMLTHANFHYVIHATQLLVPYQGERALAFLPLAHSLQRYVSYLALTTDVEAFYAESIERVPDNIREVHPSCFAVIPRVLEKVHNRVLATGSEKTGFEREVFDRSMRALAAVGRARRSGLVPGLRSRVSAKVADRLVGQKIRARLGGRVKFLGCGSAPLARDVHEFFEDIGIPILEGWGLTETSAPATLNTLNNRRIGSVGRPLPGTYVKIGDDGEILVRGPGVFTGYFDNESATRDAFDDEGWFKTGDIGQISRDGFLKITDRKKDLIITAGGKNIAPQPIEHQIKREPLIGQAVLIGDRRPYVVALIGIDTETRRDVALSHGLSPDATTEEVCALPDIQARIGRHVESVNAQLPRFEQIKKWDVLPGEMTIESGELTPTMKVKRRVVHERHASRIDRLYEG